MAKKDLFGSITVDEKALSAQVDGVIKATNGLASAIQVTVVGLAVHTALHGNLTLLRKLDKGFGEGDYTPIQRASFRAWVCKNGPCGWDSKAKHFTYNKDRALALKAEYEANSDGTIARLAQLPWHEARKESDEFTGFDLTKLLANAVKRAERMMEEHPDMLGDKVNVDFLPQLKLLLENGPARRITAPANDTGSRVH